MEKYKLIYYLNTSCANRQPTTKEAIERDWVETELEFESDLKALEYVYTDIKNDEEDSEAAIQEFYEDHDALFSDEDKLEALYDYLDPREQDISDGSVFIVELSKDNDVLLPNYFDLSINDLLEEYSDTDEYEDDEYYEESLTLEEATMLALQGKLTEAVDMDNKLNVVIKALNDNYIKYRISGDGEFGYDIYVEYNNHNYKNSQNKDHDWISSMSISLSPHRENEIRVFGDLTKECTQYLSDDQSQWVIKTFKDLRDKWVDFDKNLPTIIKILKLIDKSLTVGEQNWTNLPREERHNLADYFKYLQKLIIPAYQEKYNDELSNDAKSKIKALSKDENLLNEVIDFIKTKI